MQIYHKVKVVLANLLYYKSNMSKLEKKRQNVFNLFR